MRLVDIYVEHAHHAMLNRLRRQRLIPHTSATERCRAASNYLVDVDDVALRSVIYRHIVDTGTAPTRQQLADIIGADVDAQLRRLHDAHMIVLDDRPHRLGEIRMALPFAVEPTNFRVTTTTGAWWANCAWDSLAIIAAIHQDAHITSTWNDTGDPVALHITDGQLDHTDGYIHFRIPARHWWDDIVQT